MNSLFVVVLLAAVSFCSSSQVAEMKLGSAKQIFRPIFIPLGPAPNLTPATAAPAVVVPVSTGTVTTTNLPQCPGRCCKKYCLNGNFCTAAAPPATTPTCDPATTTFSRCVNTLSTGCSASTCTPAANCVNECGAVMNIAPIAICP